MSKKKFKKTAIHSGIGDGNHLFAKQPSSEEAKEEFKIASRAVGKKKNTTTVYPQVDFQYGVHYKGKTVDTYHEQPFDIEIPAYPKRVLEYDIEERRYLCYDRFWEIQADFEATVMRMTIEYAINYEVAEEVNSEMKFRIGWGASFVEDPLKVFVNKNSNFVGQHNSEAYQFVGEGANGRLIDGLNRPEFSGVLADDAAIPDTTVDISMSLEFRPLPAKPASSYSHYQRWAFTNDNYNQIELLPESKFKFSDGTFGSRDDDIVGFIFKAKKSNGKLNAYVFLWESHANVLSGRRALSMNGFNIGTNAITDGAYNADGSAKEYGSFAISDAVNSYDGGFGTGFQKNSAKNIAQFKKFHTSVGWKQKHKRIYKITNNVMTEVPANNTNLIEHGWDFNEWNKVRFDIKGKNVKIYTKRPGKSEELAFSFQSDFEEGTIGLCNMSQAVEYRNAEISNMGSGNGYMPIDGYETVSEGGTFHVNARKYIQPSVDAFANKEGIDPSVVEVGSMFVEYEGDTGGGVVKVPVSAPFNGPIEIEIGTKTIGHTGRIPENPSDWLTWDGIGELQLDSVAANYIKSNASPPSDVGWDSDKIKITGVTGEVKPSPDAAYDLPWSPRAENITGWFENPISPEGPLILYSNNPSDADQVYTATFYKCGFAEICPDNISKETGIVITNDVNLLFAAEIAQFFNRNTYINKKKKYSLVYPVWTPNEPELIDPGTPPELSLGGCVIKPGKDPVYGEPIPCRPEKDDFFWNELTLILWTCDPPVEYKVNSYSYGAYAFEGEIVRYHYQDFEPPNPWTTFRLIPIEETIEKPYDYVKWVGTEALEWLPPYTPVRLRTKRYFIPSWTGPYEGKNKGIVTSEQTLLCEIPPIPEYYLDPDTLTPMSYGYSGFVFMLESKNGFNLNTELELWWLSNPNITTLNVDRSAANLNKLTGIPMIRALNMADKVVIHCNEKPKYTEWTSGKYMGYGKLNGKEPLRCDGAGKADMINVPTDVVYFPDNFVPESLEGPFIDVYEDKEKYPGLIIDWKLSDDKKTVSFSTDYMGPHEWYTDWKSGWSKIDKPYKIKNHESVLIEKIENFAIDLEGKSSDEIIVENIEVTTNNPFVIAWVPNLTKEKLQSNTGRIDAMNVMAKIKDARPMDWSPMIHNGYYYMKENEHYLYADKIVHTVTPDANHEIIISPRPEQGSAIIVEDNKGNNLRKVMFHDHTFSPTLRNVEEFRGNGNSAYYLGYKGIDKDSLTVAVNGKVEPYIFYDETSRVEFMRKITKEDTIKAFYKVLYSYYIDMNYDVAGNRAKIKLHDNYNPADMVDMKITYEAASETPFYRASEVKFNPLLTHNHTGFLFITEDKEQEVKDIKINISPKTLEVNKSRKVLITAKVLDEFGNPANGKKVDLYRNGVFDSDASMNAVTNAAGEVYFYYTPIKTTGDIPSSYFDEYKVVCENKSDMDILNYYKKGNMDRKYIDIQSSKESVIGGTTDTVNVTVSLRDKNFKYVPGKKVEIEIINTDGSKVSSVYTVPVNGKISLSINGNGQKQGYIYIKAKHDMGTEEAVSLKSIKVLGG